jgi:16S rRNA G1207 methylase RsmC
MQKTIGFNSCPADTFLLAAFAARHPGKTGLPMRAIDLGSGPGRLLYEFGLLHPRAELYGLEANRDAIELAASALGEKGLAVQVEERPTQGPGVI